MIKKNSFFSIEKLLLVLFFFSGFPALVYQLVWQRALFGIFGVNIESVTIVVTAFMLGLGLGSMAGGWLSQKKSISLLPLLAIIEFSTAIFGVFSLHLFATIGAISLDLSLPVIAIITLVLVLIPTLLMGATLPVLVGFLTRRSGSTGSSVGNLYYVNTLGAGIACIAAALVLFPFFGMHKSVLIAVAINSFIAAGALIVYFRTRFSAFLALPPARPQKSKERLHLAFLPALVLAGLSGFVSLSYEIYFFRITSFASGGSATIFALTLAVFLVGLAVGARMTGLFCLDGMTQRSAPRYMVFTLVAANLIGLFFLPIVARASSFDYLGIALFLIFLQTCLWGTMLPFLAEAGILPDSKAGMRIGQIYFANIVGCACGGIFTGFVMMNFLTLVEISVVLFVIGLICALLLSWTMPLAKNFRLVLVGIIVVMIIASPFVVKFLNNKTLDRLLFKNKFGPHLSLTESLENRSGIIAVDNNETVFGDGMYDGRYSTDLVHDKNIIVRAYALSLYHQAPRNVLMIGLSSGSWAQAIVNNPQVKHVTAVEINPGYIALISKKPQVASLLNNPKFTLIIDDGRRWLQRNPAKHFDAIIMNTTYYHRVNSSNLLSTEFLNLLRYHLTTGGTIFYNSTGSSRVMKTACLAFPYGMRFSNHMLVSNMPIKLNFSRWRKVLLQTKIDGRSVINLHQKEDREYLDKLMNLGKTNYIESCQKILERTGDLQEITDDNMGSEWRHVFGLE